MQKIIIALAVCVSVLIGIEVTSAEEVCSPGGCYGDCKDHCAGIYARTSYSQADTKKYESCLVGCSLMEINFTFSSGKVDCKKANIEMKGMCAQKEPNNVTECFAVLAKWAGLTGCSE